jgi:hypothetical protein
VPRGKSVRSIAAAIGRSPLTVSRELRRNADRLGGYRATTLQALADARANASQPWVTSSDPPLPVVGAPYPTEPPLTLFQPPIERAFNRPRSHFHLDRGFIARRSASGI